MHTRRRADNLSSEFGDEEPAMTSSGAAERRDGKLTAALVLGITGGVIGIIAAFLAMAVGGLAAAFEAEGGGTVVGLGFAAVFIGVLGIVGGAMARSRPSTAAVIQAIAAIAGFIAVSAAWLISGPLLPIGALLAFLGRRR